MLLLYYITIKWMTENLNTQEKISRKDLLQASATVLAGALIFLTLSPTLNIEVNLIFMVSIYLLIIAIGVLIAPQARFGAKIYDPERSLKNGGRFFLFGLIVLFSAITFSILVP